MLLKFTVKMRAGEDARRIERLAAKLSDAKRLNTAVGRGFERTLRRHFRELDKRPNRRGWKKSHFWEKIAADTVFAGADDSRAVVSIGSDSGPKFAAKVFGARIRSVAIGKVRDKRRSFERPDCGCVDAMRLLDSPDCRSDYRYAIGGVYGLNRI